MDYKSKLKVQIILFCSAFASFIIFWLVDAVFLMWIPFAICVVGFVSGLILNRCQNCGRILLFRFGSAQNNCPGCGKKL